MLIFVGLMLGQRRRLWPNINPALGESLPEERPSHVQHGVRSIPFVFEITINPYTANPDNSFYPFS